MGITLPAGQVLRPSKLQTQDVCARTPRTTRDGVLGVFLLPSSSFWGKCMSVRERIDDLNIENRESQMLGALTW